MTDTDGTAHRSLYDPTPDEVHIREGEEVDADEGMMEVRLPIASTGQVRNEGDDPLTGSELRGMAEQVDRLSKGVFPEHGRGDFVEYGKYSQFEKLGYWADADLQRESSDDGEDLLMATARMPDPETLPAATGDYRQALAILKEQAIRGVPISASIGWRDDEAAPGGVDLMEASIVGIGADPRTNTGGGEQLVARAAIDAGADPEALIESVRAAVESERPLGPPEDPDRFESFEQCVEALMDDEDLSREEAERVCGAWEDEQTADDPEDTHDMSDDDTASEEDATTETEQDGGDTAETERAPEDVTEDDLLTFTARHFEGLDESDLMQAVDAADGEYIGECDAEALFDFVSIVTGAEYGDVEDAMAGLMTEEQGDYGDDEEEEDEDEDDDEQASDDPDEEQSTTEQDADTSDLEERIADLESELEAVRSGEVDVDTPDTADERDAAASEEPDDERDADTQEPRSLRDEVLGVNQ
jgi:hypothetical protein